MGNDRAWHPPLGGDLRTDGENSTPHGTQWLVVYFGCNRSGNDRGPMATRLLQVASSERNRTLKLERSHMIS